MIKLKWVNLIPRQWLEIATQSLEAWKLRDEKPPFLPDNKRGFARVTPIALSKVGVPNTEIHAMDEFPLHGLGLYDDYESWSRYKGYVWSGWTTRKAQPMHIDSALQALIDQSVQVDPNAASQTYIGKDSATSDSMAESKGSQLPVCNFEPPFPTPVPDVCMESSADKRSRESPDSTLKPEHKSLKTSGVAIATEEEPIVFGTSAVTAKKADQSEIKPQTIRWNVKEKHEVRPTMWRFHHSSPAWKLKICIDAMKDRPVDLSSLAQKTSVRFASEELVKMAVHCLEEITAEMKKDESKDSCAAWSSFNCKVEEGETSQQVTSGSAEASTEDQASGEQPTSSDAAPPKSESTTEVMSTQQPGAVASEEKADASDQCDPAQEQPKAWVDRVVSAGHSILWHQSTTLSLGPTLLTGVKLGEEDCLVADLLDWERKLENANLDNHAQFLRNAQLTVSNHPMEATDWENGFVPEAQGLPSDQLDQRIQESLPPLAFMVSRPRQPIAAGEELLCRFDAATRPYWLRDWQSGFGGYIKVCEYTVDGTTRRRYSVAHVVRPRTNATNACLCFTLMSKIPEHKPWKRATGEKDPSRSIILDLQEERDWKMPATVMMHTNEIQLSFDDSSQVQCLPVYRTDRPKWAYRKVPKVTKFRNFDRLPSWCRKPQGMTYQFCAEDMTKTVIVPNLPAEDRADRMDHGLLPQESSAGDRHCITCPVKRGSPKLLPCCLCYNWCHPGCS